MRQAEPPSRNMKVMRIAVTVGLWAAMGCGGGGGTPGTAATDGGDEHAMSPASGKDASTPSETADAALDGGPREPVVDGAVTDASSAADARANPGGEDAAVPRDPCTFDPNQVYVIGALDPTQA